MNKLLSLLTMILLVAAGLTACTKIESNAMDGEMKDSRRILLLGASVGKEWDLPGLPARKHAGSLEFETAAVYQYDKSEALDEILIRPKRKFHANLKYVKSLFRPAPRRPDVIIIKECAAYFPGEMESYKRQLQDWAVKIRANRIEVILATVVPVTKERAARQPGKLEGILAFNDWIRDFASKEKITILDLEAALSVSGADRSLKDDLTSGDGLHLNSKAYGILDSAILKTLNAE